jgi:hypothetical protein
MCCLGEHSRRAVACSDRFFCRIVFQIGDVVVVKFWDFVELEIVFTRTSMQSSLPVLYADVYDRSK